MSIASETAVPKADIAVQRYGQAGHDWVDGVYVADPSADAAVAAFAELPRGAGMAMFRTALAEGIDAVPDAPVALRDLFAEVDTAPAWLDHSTLDRAAGHLLRHMASYGIVLGAASLTKGAMNQVAGMPLVITNRYTSQAAVRSLEVGSWMETILTPGGLRRSGAGFATTIDPRVCAEVAVGQRFVECASLGCTDPAELHGVHHRRVREHRVDGHASARRAVHVRRAG